MYFLNTTINKSKIKVFRKNNKFMLFLKDFFAVIFAVLFAANISLAKDIRPITPKLWKVLSVEDMDNLRKISAALEKENYEEALNYAHAMSKKEIAPDAANVDSTNFKAEKVDFAEALANIILWQKYSNQNSGRSLRTKAASEVLFNDISRFVNDNPFYPNIADLRRSVEQVAVSDHVPFRLSEQYFKSNPAATLESKLYLLRAKSDFILRFKGSEVQRQKIADEIQSSIVDIWVKENFISANEQDFLNQYGQQLTESDHINRINRLLWDGKIADAKRIMNFVNDDHKSLFLAIIAIKENPKFIDNIVLSVPRKLRADENLSYSRIMWYKSQDKPDDLIDLFVKVGPTQYPEKWWNVRRLYAREMLKKKEYKIAYALVSQHNLPKKFNDFWEAEWMSGWIALRFLDQPKIAYNHFETLYNNVSQPVTLSRGAYWLGMAAQAQGDKLKAIEWYKVATKYPVFFYGQLAIHKHRLLDSVNAAEDIILPKDPDITVGDVKKISASMPAKVAYLLALMGDKAGATKIFEYVVSNASSDGQIAVVMRIVNELNDRQMDAKISRVAVRKNVFFIKDKFQIVKEVSDDEYAPLVHAIIKQESGFAPTALSSVGAIGFMQLMPDTAKLVAKDLGVKYDRKKLSTDIKYNVILGSHYIKGLIDDFDGSEMLAIASYNAGPNATKRWIREFYDPRKEKDIDRVVDWIELISYSETRNYVQRIMENLIVYKYLMSRTNYDSIK